MLLFKIAFRNVRRQIGGYLIYFITVALTVSLLFSLAGMMFSKTVFNYSMSFKVETIAVCTFLIILLTVISALVLGYGCSFLLRRRKKEFGMYLTLGMKRGNVVAIFIAEMLFTFLFSIAAGLGLGTLVYQAIVAGISSFMNVTFTWADYTSGAFILTVVLVGAVFLIISLVAANYLRLEKITALLQGENSKGKPVKNPRRWMIVALVSAVILILSTVIVAITASGDPSSSVYLFVIIGGSAVICISMVLTYAGTLKSGTHCLLQNKKFSGKGTRTFTLRQLSDRISGDSALFGIIAVLLSIVIAGGNIFMTAFGTQVAQSKLNNPYTVNVTTPYDKTGELTSELPAWLEDFGEVEEMRQYTVFEVDEPAIERYLLGSAWLLRESDYHALCKMAGVRAGDLNGGALLICNGASEDELEEKKHDAQELIGELKWETDAFSIVFNGVSPTRTNLVVFGYSYVLAVPDNVIDTLEQAGIYSSAISLCAVNYADGAFDEDALNEFFELTNREEQYENYPMDHGYSSFFYVDISGSFLPYLREMATPWMMILLFVALALTLLSMAILALKSLAAVTEDKRRYKQLYLIGASKRQTIGSLIAQIVLYFFLPFAIPILMSAPAAFICMGLNDMMGGALTNLQVIGYAAILLGVLLLFFAIYCAVTCIAAQTDVRRALRPSSK